ncbi:MAG: hypothetical protein Rhirs2KO_20990 [Rhizobiaceae bacterium]
MHIVDAEREQRRHQMLDRTDVEATRVTKQSAEIGAGNGRSACTNFGIIGPVGRAMEDNTRVWVCRTELNGNRLSVVNTNA